MKGWTQRCLLRGMEDVGRRMVSESSRADHPCPRGLGFSEDCRSLRVNNVQSSTQAFPCMKTVTALRREPAQVPQSRAPLNVLVVRIKGICTSPCTAALGGHSGWTRAPSCGFPCLHGPSMCPVVGGASHAWIISLSPAWILFPNPAFLASSPGPKSSSLPLSCGELRTQSLGACKPL